MIRIFIDDELYMSVDEFKRDLNINLKSTEIMDWIKWRK